MKKLVSLILALCLLACASVCAEEAPTELTVVVCRRTTDITKSYSEKHWVIDSEKACNVKINWIELVEGQTDEPLAALLAGDLPDVLFMGSKISDSLVSENAKLWQPLTEEEIQTYCPNIYGIYEEYLPQWREFLTYPDGNIYGLASGEMTTYHNKVQGVQYLNHRWLENLNLEVPTTLEEFHDMLVAFKEQDANGNGDPSDEIPIDFCNNHYAASIWTFASMWGIANGVDVYYNIENGEVVGTVNTPAFREFLEYFHQLGQEGLLNLEGFSQTQEQYNANLDGGKVGVFWGYGPYNYITTDAKLDYEALVPVPAEGYSTKVRGNNAIAANRNGFLITTACKDKEAALRWYDYLSAKDYVLNVHYGDEGYMWKMWDDGVHYQQITYSSMEEQNAKIGERYPELIDKDFNGGNTTGYINNAPMCPFIQSPDPEESNSNFARRYRSVQIYDEAGVISDSMSQSIVPNDAQEELDFNTDGLKNLIEGFVADSIINGVTDESWNAFQSNLERNNYSFYIEWQNRHLHNEF